MPRRRRRAACHTSHAALMESPGQGEQSDMEELEDQDADADQGKVPGCFSPRKSPFPSVSMGGC
eukprot:713781-Hanusia_phi.AAC.1